MKTDKSRAASAAPLYALVFGSLALLFNILMITLPLGCLFGVIALVCGWISRTHEQKSGGLMLSLLSFLVLLYWIASLLIPVLVDPTLQLFHT